MRAGVLGFYILSLTLIFSVLSTVVQAIEYREVNTEVQAADILNHFEKGDDVNFTNCRIVGELNSSKIKLEMIPNHRFRRGVAFGLKSFSGNENLSVIKSRIIIRNSIFENKLNLNARFNNSVDFTGTTFNNCANFPWAYFNNSADFGEAKFNNAVLFGSVTFSDAADFKETTFNNSADFVLAQFKNSTDFG